MDKLLIIIAILLVIDILLMLAFVVSNIKNGNLLRSIEELDTLIYDDLDKIFMGNRIDFKHRYHKDLNKVYDEYNEKLANEEEKITEEEAKFFKGVYYNHDC